MMRTLTGVTNQVFFQANEANNGNISFPVGNVGIGTTSPGYPLHVYNLGTGLKVEAAGEAPYTQKIAE